MKKSGLILIVLLFALATDSLAQGFLNLNFENAIIVADPSGSFYPYSVYASNAIPGWTAFLGNYQATDVLYNDETLGDPSIDLIATNNTFGIAVFQGRYSVILQTGGDPSIINGVTYGSYYNASILQVGLVPTNANSLQLEVSSNSAGSLAVSFSGQNLSLIPIGAGANYTLYGADISQFAGQVGTLTISAVTNLNPYSAAEIDSISFSPTSVPEPSKLDLTLFGAFVLGFRRGKYFLKWPFAG